MWCMDGKSATVSQIEWPRKTELGIKRREGEQMQARGTLWGEAINPDKCGSGVDSALSSSTCEIHSVRLDYHPGRGQVSGVNEGGLLNLSLSVIYMLKWNNANYQSICNLPLVAILIYSLDVKPREPSLSQHVGKNSLRHWLYLILG